MTFLLDLFPLPFRRILLSLFFIESWKTYLVPKRDPAFLNPKLKLCFSPLQCKIVYFEVFGILIKMFTLLIPVVNKTIAHNH